MQRLAGYLPVATVLPRHQAPRRLREDQLRALEALGRQAVNLLELHLQQARIEEMATLDSLTKLKNYGAFQERLESEMTRALRYQQSLSLILLDVDRFKPFNDA